MTAKASVGAITCRQCFNVKPSFQAARPKLYAAMPQLHHAKHRQAITYGKKDREQSSQPSSDSEAATTTSSPDVEKDFWEGEAWEAFGVAASWAIPIIAGGALAVGLFAARVYDDDASVYLQSAQKERAAEFITFGE